MAATVTNVSSPVATNCSASLDLSVGLGVFYQQLLCQLSLVGQSREAVQAQLLSLQQQMAGLLQTSGSAMTIQFPTDLNPVIDALLTGQCGQAAGLLAAPNQNTQIGNTDYNALINDQYSTIENTIATNLSIPFSIHLQAFAPFDKFGFGFDGDGYTRKIGNNRNRFRLYVRTALEYQATKIAFIRKQNINATSKWFDRNIQTSETNSVVDYIESGVPRRGSLQMIAWAGNDATMVRQINEYWEKNYNTDIGDLSDMNIDRNLTLSLEMIETDLRTKILKVSGLLQGEFFPATDLFIRDKMGQEITLGGAAAKINMSNLPCNICHCEAKSCGPFAQLRKPIFVNFDVNLSIRIQNGVFKAVMDSSGKEWTIGEWNQSWLSKETVIIIP